MASSEFGENFGEPDKEFREIRVKRRDTFQSLTQLQNGFEYQKVKRKKRRKRHPKHEPSAEMTAKRISRTALDTMTLRTIRKIPSMSTFTWQHISEEIETQMSKIELEGSSPSQKIEVQGVYDTSQKSDSNCERFTFKKGHRKVNIKHQEKRKHKKKTQEMCSPQDNFITRLENNRPRVQISEYQDLNKSLTNDGVNRNDTTAADAQEGEEQKNDKNKNGPTGANEGDSCSTGNITKLSLQGSDSHSEYERHDITNQVKGSILKTLRTSTKSADKRTNRVRFKVRLPPLNIGRKVHVGSHSVGRETTQVSYRKACVLPTLVLPGNITLKTLTVNDNRNSLEFTESNNIEEDERCVFQNQEPKKVVKNKKRSQSAVFKRFREYYAKRPHATVS